MVRFGWIGDGLCTAPAICIPARSPSRASRGGRNSHRVGAQQLLKQRLGAGLLRVVGETHQRVIGKNRLRSTQWSSTSGTRTSRANGRPAGTARGSHAMPPSPHWRKGTVTCLRANTCLGRGMVGPGTGTCLPGRERIGLPGGRLPTLDCYAPRASVTAAIAAISASLMGLSSPSVLAPATRFASEMTKRR